MSELTLILQPLIPEIVLVVGAMALLLLGVVRPETERQAERICWLALGVVGVALWQVLAQLPGTELLFEGGFVIDDFARFMKILTLIGSAGALFLSFDYMRETRSLTFEYPVLVLLASAGMLMMISANDLIALYLGLELQSLALYVVAAIRRDLEAAEFRHIEAETIERRSRAASYRDPAIGYCQGTPLRNEIEARDRTRLEEATETAASALMRRFGAGPVDAHAAVHTERAIAPISWLPLRTVDIARELYRHPPQPVYR